MIKVKKGDKAPDFELLDQDNNKVKLSDYKGKKVLLYFYSKASTSGWMKQSCSVRDAKKDLKEFNVDVVGISPDTPDLQKIFDEKYSFGFPLLSDVEHKVADTYGVWGVKNLYGKKVQGINRSSFLIDEKGILIDLWFKVRPLSTAAKALSVLE